LLAVDPGRGNCLDGVRKSREVCSTICYRHEARIETTGHRTTGTRKRALRGGVILGLEGEEDRVTNSGRKCLGSECKATCTNIDHVSFGSGEERGSKKSERECREHGYKGEIGKRLVAKGRLSYAANAKRRERRATELAAVV